MNILLSKFTGLKLAELKWHAVGLLGAIVLLLLGGGIGWQTHATEPQDKVAAALAIAPTQVPVSEANTAVAVKALNSPSLALPSLRVWEASPVPLIDNTAKPLTPEAWKISGVYANSAGHSVILEFPSRQVSEYVKQGGELPNGAKVLAVGEHTVTVKTKVANQWKTIVLDLDADNF